MVGSRQVCTTGRGVSQRLLGHPPSPSCYVSELVQYKHLVRPGSKPFVSSASLCSKIGTSMHFSPEHTEATATASSQYHFPAPPHPFVRWGKGPAGGNGWLVILVLSSHRSPQRLTKEVLGLICSNKKGCDQSELSPLYWHCHVPYIPKKNYRMYVSDIFRVLKFESQVIPPLPCLLPQ